MCIRDSPPRGVFKDGKIASVPGNHGGTDEFGEYAYIRAIRQVGDCLLYTSRCV